MTDPNAVFKDFAEQVAVDFPNLQEVLDQAKSGHLSETDAMRALTEMVVQDPDLGRRFQQVALAALRPLREEDAAKPLDHEGAVLHKKRGLPRLNPLAEAALIERAQFDDDIPELRTGCIPEGVHPAVAVDTTARNPVAIGRMLKEASQQVASKIAAKEPERQQLIADAATLALVAQSGTTLVKKQERDLIFDGKSDVVDPPEYRRGAVPAPRHVTQPSGGELLALTPDERKQSAWAFLSTTQGRRSAIRGITEMIEAKLRSAGFIVTSRPFEGDAQEPILAASEWSVGIDGPGAMQSSFNLIDIAATTIALGLINEIGDRRGRVLLEVTSVNTVDIRSVGWAGRLLALDAALPGTMSGGL